MLPRSAAHACASPCGPVPGVPPASPELLLPQVVGRGWQRVFGGPQPGGRVQSRGGSPHSGGGHPDVCAHWPASGHAPLSLTYCSGLHLLSLPDAPRWLTGTAPAPSCLTSPAAVPHGNAPGVSLRPAGGLTCRAGPWLCEDGRSSEFDGNARCPEGSSPTCVPLCSLPRAVWPQTLSDVSFLHQG